MRYETVWQMKKTPEESILTTRLESVVILNKLLLVQSIFYALFHAPLAGFKTAWINKT